MLCVMFFFFNQKTAYEMRISDWSSDVCSSYLLLRAVPYKIHTILTDNGIQFADQPRNRNTAFSRQMRFDMICEANGIKHRLTKPNHPWTTDKVRSEEHTSELQSLMRISYAVFCLKKKTTTHTTSKNTTHY